MNALRAARALTVSLVADVDSAVAGHIAFSPARIDDRECRRPLPGPQGSRRSSA